LLKQSPAKYDFGYAEQSKDDYSYVDFGNNENRNGEKTKGQYYVVHLVVFSDGRRQVVNYAIDGYSGYVPNVKYEGNYKPAYKPIYVRAADGIQTDVSSAHSHSTFFLHTETLRLNFN
jgi:hypothetical protein